VTVRADPQSNDPISQSTLTNASIGVVEERIDIYPARVPPFDHWMTFQVWLALASSDYFDSEDTNSMPDINHGGSSPLRPVFKTLRAEIEKMSYSGYWLPRQIHTYNLGFFVMGNDNASSQRHEFAPPFNQGYLISRLRVETTRMVNGMDYPETCSWDLFARKPDARSNSDIWCSLQTKITIPTFKPDATAEAATVDFEIAVVPGKLTFVLDARVQDTSGQPLRYYTRNGIIKPDSAQAQSILNETQMKNSLVAQFRKDDSPSAPRSIVLVLIIGLLFFPPLFLFWRHKSGSSRYGDSVRSR